MPSKASEAFDKNGEDVRQLLANHRILGGDEKGRRFGLGPLNKSAIVLITAIWEAYCEDIAAEALEHLIANVPSASRLPKDLKKRITAEVKSDPHELAMWELADSGWKHRARRHLSSITEERNRRLNTPKTAQIDELFAVAIGLLNVSGSWRWRRMSAEQARTKLDKFVTLRGDIAHRGAKDLKVKKAEVVDYFRHVGRLVAKTASEVNSHVQDATGKPLW